MTNGDFNATLTIDNRLFSEEGRGELSQWNELNVFHDKFTGQTFLGKEGLLELSIPPAMVINYYGLIGKELRKIYEQPKNNNLIGDKK